MNPVHWPSECKFNEITNDELFIKKFCELSEATFNVVDKGEEVSITAMRKVMQLVIEYRDTLILNEFNLGNFFPNNLDVDECYDYLIAPLVKELDYYYYCPNERKHLIETAYETLDSIKRPRLCSPDFTLLNFEKATS